MRKSQLPNFFIVYSIFHLPSFIRLSNGMVLFKFSPTKRLKQRRVSQNLKNDSFIYLYRSSIDTALTNVFCANQMTT
jgi:hypothetical protein